MEAVPGVRIPHPPPICNVMFYGEMAELVRQRPAKAYNRKVARVRVPLSPPVLCLRSSVGLEYRATNAGVTGSSPVASATFVFVVL